MRSPREQQRSFEVALRQLRTHHFLVLSTVDPTGRPNSAGVNYGVSAPERPLAIYTMTRKHLQKARNIAQNPSVSLVVPLGRHFLWFLPPPTMQIHGRAEILDWTDREGTNVFQGFWMGRRILDGYNEFRRRGETRTCFLKITPDPVISTYMVGISIWQARRRIESAVGKVVIPPALQAPTQADALEVKSIRSH